MNNKESANKRRIEILNMIKEKGFRNLPTRNELGKQFGVSHNQIQKDIQALQKDLFTDIGTVHLEFDTILTDEIQRLNRYIEWAESNQKIVLAMKALEQKRKAIIEEIEIRLKLGIIKAQPKEISFQEPIQIVCSYAKSQSDTNIPASPLSAKLSQLAKEVQTDADRDKSMKIPSPV